MTAKEAISIAVKEKGITQAEAAARVGMSPTQLSARIVRGSLRADTFIEILDAVGFDVVLVSQDTKKVLRSRVAGMGRRVRKMIDHVPYDTYKADALSNNFYADGVNEYTDGRARELYVDDDGHYFFAEYCNWSDGGEDTIIPIGSAEAADFISKHGNVIEKGPTEAE